MGSQAQVIKDARQGELPFEMGKVKRGALAEAARVGYVVRGDHWFNRCYVRRVARGLLIR
jgi:hypothetical protein